MDSSTLCEHAARAVADDATRATATSARRVAPTPAVADQAPPRIQAVTFTLTILNGGNTQSYVSDASQRKLGPPTWFAVELNAPVEKRYVHLIQKEVSSRSVVIYLLAYRDALALPLRLPQEGVWLRAIVTGTVHVLGADKPLRRDEIVKQIGGREPPPPEARPPFT